MGLPPGRTIRLSYTRRFMRDMLAASRKVPLVAIERTLQIAPLIAARKAAQFQPRMSWFTLFLKAYALVSEQRPELRRAYLSFPWPRLHEHACSVASIAVARPFDEQNPLVICHIRNPQQRPLTYIDERIRRSRTRSVAESSDLRRQVRIGRFPWPIRPAAWWLGLNVSGDWRARFAGTFGITGVAALGSMSLHTLSPLTTTLTYGVIQPEGSVLVRLFYDHRVLDGVQPAEALRELEDTLNGAIVSELQGSARAAA